MALHQPGHQILAAPGRIEALGAGAGERPGLLRLRQSVDAVDEGAGEIVRRQVAVVDAGVEIARPDERLVEDGAADQPGDDRIQNPRRNQIILAGGG